MYCKPINIIWIERGIILILIEYITENYKYLRNKNIVLENDKYRYFIERIFSKLMFSIKENPKIDNIYFNIRKIIKNKHVIIDYLKNYNTIIPGIDVKIIPWFDNNDPLIFFIKNSKVNTPVNDIKNIINKLYCQRGNFYNSYWDLHREKQIFMKMSKLIKNISWIKIYKLLNTYFKKTQQTHVINKYHFIPILNKNKNSSNNLSSSTTIRVDDSSIYSTLKLIDELIRINTKIIDIKNK